jgi:hypothetical protein
MCHVSHVTCHIYFFFGQSGEAYRLRVYYQRGLPRLVIFPCSKPICVPPESPKTYFVFSLNSMCHIFNRPGVAGAVLQTALSLINLFIN